MSTKYIICPNCDEEIEYDSNDIIIECNECCKKFKLNKGELDLIDEKEIENGLIDEEDENNFNDNVITKF